MGTQRQRIPEPPHGTALMGCAACRDVDTRPPPSRDPYYEDRRSVRESYDPYYGSRSGALHPEHAGPPVYPMASSSSRLFPVRDDVQVVRRGDETRSRIIATPRAGGSRAASRVNTPHNGTSYGPPSGQPGDDEGEELVLVCADCLAEIMDSVAPARCPATGKMHH